MPKKRYQATLSGACDEFRDGCVDLLRLTVTALTSSIIFLLSPFVDLAGAPPEETETSEPIRNDEAPLKQLSPPEVAAYWCDQYDTMILVIPSGHAGLWLKIVEDPFTEPVVELIDKEAKARIERAAR